MIKQQTNHTMIFLSSSVTLKRSLSKLHDRFGWEWLGEPLNDQGPPRPPLLATFLDG